MQHFLNSFDLINIWTLFKILLSNLKLGLRWAMDAEWFRLVEVGLGVVWAGGVVCLNETLLDLCCCCWCDIELQFVFVYVAARPATDLLSLLLSLCGKVLNLDSTLFGDAKLRFWVVELLLVFLTEKLRLLFTCWWSFELLISVVVDYFVLEELLTYYFGCSAFGNL